MSNFYKELANNAVKIGKHPDFKEYDIYYNNNKKLGFIDLSFNASEIKDDYSSKYRLKLNQNINPYYLERQKLRASSQYQFIVKYSQKTEYKNILDIGTSIGSLLKEFENTSNLFGFEPDKNMINHAKKSLPNAQLQNNIFDKSLIPKIIKFDLITLSHVIEHLTNPIEKITEFLNLLNANGLMFIEVPYDNKRLLKQITDSKFEGLYHTYFYQPKSITEIIENAGGKVIALKQFGYKHSSFNYILKNKTIWQKFKSKFIRNKKTIKPNLHNVYNIEKRKGIWLRLLVKKNN